MPGAGTSSPAPARHNRRRTPAPPRARKHEPYRLKGTLACPTPRRPSSKTPQVPSTTPSAGPIRLTEDETIDTSTWDAHDALTRTDEDHTDGTAALDRVGDGDFGTDYKITNTVTTSAGRTDRRSIPIFIPHRHAPRGRIG
jgi:hypothetical protein